MKKIRVSSIPEFIEVASELADGWDELWFRGCAKIDFGLVPGLYWRGVKGWESTIEHDFLVSYKAYGDHHGLHSWEKYALMQHHGLPTRLLDWTKTPLVALFFALAQEDSYEGASVIWAMSPHQLNDTNHFTDLVYCPSETTLREIEIQGKKVNIDRYLPPNLSPHGYELAEKPLAIEASYSGERIKSQQGCFTVHGSELRSIDQYFEPLGDKAQLAQIIIESPRGRSGLRKELYWIGIDEEFIYQDLDSVCKKITRKYCV